MEEQTDGESVRVLIMNPTHLLPLHLHLHPHRHPISLPLLQLRNLLAYPPIHL